MAPAVVPPSKSRKAFERNKEDIARLWEIHGEVAGAGPGRKWGVEILNRAAMVFVCAAWEAYVEDVALEAHQLLLDSGALPQDTPEDADKARARVRTLHTPFPEKVRALFRDVIWLQDVTTEWYWQNMTAAVASQKLREYVEDRCEVAHRLAGEVPIPKSWGTDFLQHVTSLVECTDSAVFRHVRGLLGRDPW